MAGSQKRKSVLKLYQRAQSEVVSAGYGWEIDWQRSRQFSKFSESDLLREAAWVVLCSGFREATVRKVFDYLSLCFCDWESAEVITKNSEVCRATAITCFGNHRKVDAILQIAKLVNTQCFSNVQSYINNDPIGYLQCFPFIGPITSWHLAKNLGLNVAKNDRHLARIANNYGYHDAGTLCDAIARMTGETISVIDVVLWRFATFKPSFVSFNYD